MKIEPLTQFTFSEAEVEALYEICMSALEANLLDGLPLAFAMAVADSLSSVEPDHEEGDDEVTLQ